MPPVVKQPLDTIPYVGDTTPFPYIHNYKTLLNQPLDTVRRYIDGKWILEMTFGGRSAIRHYDNTFVWFKLDDLGIDSIHWYTDTIYYANGPVSFSHERVIFDTGFDVSYVMKFEYFPMPLPWGWRWFAFRANSDSLYLQDDFVDGYFYFLTRVH